jgi:plastocyanin
VALLVAMIPSTAAWGTDRTGALALAGAKFYGYATPVIILQPGEQLTFTNIDIDEHDVVQDIEVDGFGSDDMMPWCKMKGGKHSHAHKHKGCPLFWSTLVGMGESTAILGLENLEPGMMYSFFCTKHHSMKGTLIVQ